MALTICIAQISGEPYDSDGNRELTVRTAREAFQKGARLVVMPELIIPGYVSDGPRLAGLAEPLDGPSVRAWTEVAGEAGGYVAGGFCERAGDDIYNTAVLVGPEGVVLHYRKLHLFATEKDVFAPGDLGLPVAETEIGTIGMCVCYDLRFVETVRVLALKGADLICVPTAWLPGFDTERWDENGLAPQAKGAILQANLDQVFIACASQAGRHGELDFLGSSVLADPRGRVLLGPLSGTDDDVVLAEIDIEEAKAAQHRGAGIDPRKDRRTDVYGLAADGTVL